MDGRKIKVNGNTAIREGYSGPSCCAVCFVSWNPSVSQLAIYRYIPTKLRLAAAAATTAAANTGIAINSIDNRSLVAASSDARVSFESQNRCHARNRFASVHQSPVPSSYPCNICPFPPPNLPLFLFSHLKEIANIRSRCQANVAQKLKVSSRKYPFMCLFPCVYPAVLTKFTPNHVTDMKLWERGKIKFDSFRRGKSAAIDFVCRSRESSRISAMIVCPDVIYNGGWVRFLREN